MKSQNLVFIMTDHQRADSIHMIQDVKEVTPNLNRLANSGTNYKSAYNACPLCVPARTALATGKNPISSEMILNDVNGNIAKDHPTIHDYFAKAGFDVAHVGVHHIRVKPDLKERVNFKLWIDEDDYAKYSNEKGLSVARNDADTIIVDELQDGEYRKKKYSGTRISNWDKDFEDFKDIYFTRKAVEFIEEEHTRPFALFLYLWAPHPPLIVPKPYDNMFNENNLDLPDNVGISANGEPAIRRKGIAAQMANNITLGEWKKIWSAHLGLVNMADHAIGRILEALDKNGYSDDTVIVFTSDHGEHLGQHSMYQKMEMYDQAIKVPAIFKVPGGKTQEIDTPISHLDFLPTILDLFNIKHNQEFEGASLKSNLLEGSELEERDIFSVYCGNHCRGDIRRAVISKGYKYIYDSVDEKELYDLNSDPLEMNNLASKEEYSDIVQKMHEKLKDWGIKNKDYITY